MKSGKAMGLDGGSRGECQGAWGRAGAAWCEWWQV